MDKLDILYKHKDEYIFGYGPPYSDALRAFDCLVCLVEDGMSITDMIAHGCEEEWFKELDSKNE